MFFSIGLVVQVAHYQNTRNMSFKVPLVPFVPALSILCNIELMVHLSPLTWLRFFIWMIVGLLLYFCYGIHHSREGSLGTSYSMLLSSGGRGSVSSLGTTTPLTKADDARGWGSATTARIGRLFEKATFRKMEDHSSIIAEDNDS